MAMVEDCPYTGVIKGERLIIIESSDQLR
jgi:hypothetical protein